MTSPPFRVLLDKGVVRRSYEFQVRVAQGVAPTPSQVEVIKVQIHLARLAWQTYITQQTANLLQLRPPRYANAILNNTKVLQKGPYLRRWARRLRDFVFTREDAVILAYGSFGVDPAVPGVGVEVIVTTDLRLTTNFDTRYAEIKERFDRMTANLPEPYRNSALPEVMTPATVLSE